MRTKPHLKLVAPGSWLCTTPGGQSCRAPTPDKAFSTAVWMECQYRRAAQRKPRGGLRPSIDIELVRRLLQPPPNPGDGVLRFGGGKTLRDRINAAGGAFND